MSEIQCLFSFWASETEKKMKKIDNSTIGGRIKEQRIKKRMTQEQLAEKMCITKAIISMYENNKVDIKGSVIVEMARMLDTTAGYLLNREMSVADGDAQIKELMELFRGLGNDEIRRIALEQISVLIKL